jgi:adenosylmethionine-8-amino-7-oxononanoate aminotransferase
VPFSYPDSPVFYRKLTRTYPLIVRGEGCWLFDAAGRSYLDGCGGAFVVNIGHGVTAIGDAMARQAARVAYVSGMVFTHEAAESLAAEIVARAPGDLDHAYFLSSGSEAVEAALKLARQYWVESARPDKHKVLALTPSYHGNTLLALSASAREQYRSAYRDWLVTVPRVPAPYVYRCACRGHGPPCAACSGDALEAAILHEGADSVAAFIAEPIGGSSTGASVPRPEFWRRIREICDRHQVLFVADEVLSGAGRTGTWSALEPYGVSPDILVLGKGITGGYAPLSAVVAPRRIVDVLAEGSGALLHAQTYSHHAVACAAGFATLEYIADHDLVARCAGMAPAFHAALEPLRDLPHVGDVRGRGLLAGIEFVADKASRVPFPRSVRFAERFAEAALNAGLVVWPNAGQADGINGDLVMLAPPFIITESEIAMMADRLRTALAATVATTVATTAAQMPTPR